MDIMRQSTCLLVNPIAVDSYDFLFIFNDGWSGLRLNDGPDVKL